MSVGYGDSVKSYLDRIDNDLGYYPSNCRFINSQINGSNKRNTLRHDYQGQSLTLKELSSITGLSVPTLRYRLKRYNDIQLPLRQ